MQPRPGSPSRVTADPRCTLGVRCVTCRMPRPTCQGMERGSQADVTQGAWRRTGAPAGRRSADTLSSFTIIARSPMGVNPA